MIMMTFATQPKCLPVTKVFFIKRTGKLHQRAVRLGQLDRDVKLLHERDVASSGSGDALRILQGRLLDVVALVNNVAGTSDRPPPSLAIVPVGVGRALVSWKIRRHFFCCM